MTVPPLLIAVASLMLSRVAIAQSKSTALVGQPTRLRASDTGEGSKALTGNDNIEINSIIGSADSANGENSWTPVTLHRSLLARTTATDTVIGDASEVSHAAHGASNAASLAVTTGAGSSGRALQGANLPGAVLTMTIPPVSALTPVYGALQGVANPSDYHFCVYYRSKVG